MVGLREFLPPKGADPADVVEAFGRLGDSRRATAVRPPGGGHAQPRHGRPRRAGHPDRLGQEPGRHGRGACSRSTPAGAPCGPRRSRPSSPRSSSTSSTCWAPNRSAWPPATPSINPDAAVLVCTAEVLANHALATGAGQRVRLRLPRRVPLLRRRATVGGRGRCRCSSSPTARCCSHRRRSAT